MQASAAPSISPNAKPIKCTHKKNFLFYFKLLLLFFLIICFDMGLSVANAARQNMLQYYIYLFYMEWINLFTARFSSTIQPLCSLSPQGGECSVEFILMGWMWMDAFLCFLKEMITLLQFWLYRLHHVWFFHWNCRGFYAMSAIWCVLVSLVYWCFVRWF